MNTYIPNRDNYQISSRFRSSIEERILRLERDANADEATLPSIQNPDHLRRHMRLVAVQRAEALRMKLFLDRSLNRLPQTLIGI